MPQAQIHRGHFSIAAALALAAGRATAAPATTADTEFFEQKIRPVLVAECYECHDAKKQKGGLRLDYRDGWKKGGDSGDAIIPGDAAKSLFIDAIRHTDPDLKMPSKSPKLDDAIIADFEKWVNAGAHDPRDKPPTEEGAKPVWTDLLAARKGWWSLQPVRNPPLPPVRDAEWSSNPLDRFLLSKMEEKGLAPARPADPRTLIRRLSFALTGLPPTTEEVEAFVAESIRNPQSAIRNSTARLVASPRFGERFARHWMDLMRYAETHGSESDPEIPQAWRYRDYLIRAFNADVPADQLIREHLAGDLLAHPRMNAAGFNESILGTAHFRLVEHGFQPVDTLDDQVKTVDSQIDVVSKAFQGLTISCARCHDHKFDAISQRDYYALYGIFASCRPAQVTIDSPAVQAKNRVELDALHGRIRAALADAWSGAVEKIVARLKDEAGQAAKEKTIRELDERISNLEWNARQKIIGASAPRAVAPVAAWCFDGDPRDALGKLHGHLEGGAQIRNGRLILNGTGAFLRTDPLTAPLAEMTLEAWTTAANLDQRGGSVLTVESTGVHAFASICFGEQEPRRWTSGSNNFTRTQSVGGTAEDAKPGELIHLAITLGADNRIAVYRNGVPYGSAYTKGELRTYEAGRAQVLIGLRHMGAGNGFFAGEVEEARLYNRVLSADEIAASFRAGTPPIVTPEQLTSALTPEQRDERAAWKKEVGQLRGETAGAGKAWGDTMKDAGGNTASPFHPWAKLGAKSDADFSAAWTAFAAPLRAKIEESRSFNRENFRTMWDVAGADYAQWFRTGSGLDAQPVSPGEFSIEATGERVLDGLAPAGALTSRLSERNNGIFTSPRFKIETDNISVRAFGGGGAMVRVIVDNYPLPTNPIFPKAVLEKDEPGWLRLDTAYRKGAHAYLEFATRDDLTRPLSDKKGKTEGASFFGGSRIVMHDGKDAPREESDALLPLLDGPPPQSAAALAARYQRAIGDAVAAWRGQRVTEPQRALLDFLVRRGLLPATLPELETVRPLIAEYRRLQSEITIPQRAPGVLETRAYDAPLMPRGDHLTPGELVPRGYLGVFGGGTFATTQSGRLELANAITGPGNPLAARVMVNRVWHWLFGRGIVPTVDNFGRLGEKPTHPELLDFLATHFVEHGWSVKELVRFIVTTRAYQMSSEPSGRARESDPANDWLSHFRVRRIEAEAVRDSLLAVSGKLDATMFGVGAEPGAPRRSVYLAVRRTNLNPFLDVFDAPKPFGTLGRRDATNVPAQSLTLLNSPFVIEQSRAWAQRLLRERDDTADARIQRMFASALARPATNDELLTSRAFLDDLAREQTVPPDKLLASERVWQDFAQALFNLKEFIYLR